MPRSYSTSSHAPRQKPSFTSFVLVFSGALAFCAAVLVLTFDILSGLSGMYTVVAGAIPGVSGQAIVISVGLLLLGVPSMLYGLVLLFLRL